MLVALQIILVIMLLFVIYQDLNTRTIHVILPISVFVIALGINYYNLHLNMETVLPNLLFVLVNIVGLILYTSLKSQKVTNPINKTLGIGDVVFFIAITPMFNLKPFILFFILGLIFSLLIHTISCIFRNIKTIPLAGYFALFLILNVMSHFTIANSFLF